ncbi:MAG TPA: hypothetical protein V6C88_18910 [Chroococcidiopsis sp.]
MATHTSRYTRQIGPAEQQIYDHLLRCVEQESPSDLIDRFHALFIDGSTYSDAEIAAALDAVISSKTAVEDFRYVLNRCCHILINRWQTRPQSQSAIPELINLFDGVHGKASPGVYRSRSSRRLKELTSQFRETEQYHTLCRLSKVMSEAIEASTNQQLGGLIRRYPYLYEHCLLSEDSTLEQQSTIRQIQASNQRQFEIDLSQYVTYRVRQNQFAKGQLTERQLHAIKPVSNPTLLEDRELGLAIKHYVGKIDGSNTHRDLARNFIARSSYTPSYSAFKDDLYQYILSTVDPSYGKQQFNKQLYLQLKNTFPDSDSQPISDFLIVRTCSQLLNFLVVDSPSCPNHFVFIDLMTNLGPILTTGLLLKILLLCRKVKPYLERRFSILYNHYESYNRDIVQWLINALEHLNIALSTNFGAVDLSFIR